PIWPAAPVTATLKGFALRGLALTSVLLLADPHRRQSRADWVRVETSAPPPTHLGRIGSPAVLPGRVPWTTARPDLRWDRRLMCSQDLTHCLRSLGQSRGPGFTNRTNIPFPAEPRPWSIAACMSTAIGCPADTPTWLPWPRSVKCSRPS